MPGLRTGARVCDVDGVPLAEGVSISGRLPYEEFYAAQEKPFPPFFNSYLYLYDWNIYVCIYIFRL